MNLNPDQPDDTIDETLLDEALREPTPAELEAKILELTDPQMLSLLDEALAPDEASDALTQRILAATTGQPAQTPDAPAVVARIGPSTLRYAAAAAIALAAGLGVYFISQGPDAADNTIADNTDTPSSIEDDATSAESDWLTEEQFIVQADYFSSDTDPIAEAIDSDADSLDDAAITRESLWAELDAFEVFFDEFES